MSSPTSASRWAPIRRAGAPKRHEVFNNSQGENHAHDPRTCRNRSARGASGGRTNPEARYEGRRRRHQRAGQGERHRRRGTLGAGRGDREEEPHHLAQGPQGQGRGYRRRRRREELRPDQGRRLPHGALCAIARARAAEGEERHERHLGHRHGGEGRARPAPGGGRRARGERDCQGDGDCPEGEDHVAHRSARQCCDPRCPEPRPVQGREDGRRGAGDLYRGGGGVDRAGEEAGSEERGQKVGPDLQARQGDLARVVLAVLFIGGLMLASFWILRPFLGALVWGVMIVIPTWPLMLRAERMCGGRRWAAVALMSAVLLALFVVPVFAAIGTLVANTDEIRGWVQRLETLRLPPPPGWVENLPLVGGRAATAWRGFGDEALGVKLAPYANDVAHWVLAQMGS